jgi:SAM-dependent methyltransferase
MLVAVQDCIPDLRCPRTKKLLERTTPETLTCVDGHKYPIVRSKPILIDFSGSVMSEDEIVKSGADSPVVRHAYSGLKGRIKRILSPRKKGTLENVRRLVGDLEKLGRPARLLMVGGGSIGQGMDELYDHPHIRIYSFDVYDSPYVQFVADAHHIPLPDDFFDAVVVQAVLEHVLQPSQVVSEIWRVLRDEGLVYAETPFMQQVHEGAFDFTRFTESGHRYLFRDFDDIASGANGGPGVQFMWSVDHLVRGVFRSPTAGKVAKFAFFWTQYLDHFIPPAYAQDGASGVFFYGRKSHRPMTPRAIISYYKGAQGSDVFLNRIAHAIKDWPISILYDPTHEFVR